MERFNQGPDGSQHKNTDKFHTGKQLMKVGVNALQHENTTRVHFESARIWVSWVNLGIACVLQRDLKILARDSDSIVARLLTNNHLGGLL